MPLHESNTCMSTPNHTSPLTTASSRIIAKTWIENRGLFSCQNRRHRPEILTGAPRFHNNFIRGCTFRLLGWATLNLGGLVGYCIVPSHSGLNIFITEYHSSSWWSVFFAYTTQRLGTHPSFLPYIHVSFARSLSNWFSASFMIIRFEESDSRSPTSWRAGLELRMEYAESGYSHARADCCPRPWLWGGIVGMGWVSRWTYPKYMYLKSENYLHSQAIHVVVPIKPGLQRTDTKRSTSTRSERMETI